MEDFTETTSRSRRLMSLASAAHLGSIVVRLAAAQLLLCQVVWLWPSWVLAVGSQSQQGSAWRPVNPWKDRIESPEQMLTKVAEAQPAQQVCVYFHSGSFVAGTESSQVKREAAIGTAISLVQLQRHAVGQNMVFYTCHAPSVSYIREPVSSAAISASRLAAEFMPRIYPALVCYRSLLDSSLFHLPATSTQPNFGALSVWLDQQLTDRSRRFLHAFPVDDRNAVNSCLDNSQLCAIAYVPHVMLGDALEVLLKNFTRVCHNVVLHCLIVSPAYPELGSLISDDNTGHVWSSGAVWLFNTQHSGKMLFDFDAPGMLRFQLHAIMSGNSPVLLTTETFSSYVNGEHPWIVVFVNCNGDLQLITLSIHLIQLLERLSSNLTKRGVIPGMRFGVVDSACSGAVLESAVQPDLLTGLPLAVLFPDKQGSGRRLEQRGLDINELSSATAVDYLVRIVSGNPEQPSIHVHARQTCSSGKPDPVTGANYNYKEVPLFNNSARQCLVGREHFGGPSTGAWKVRGNSDHPRSTMNFTNEPANPTYVLQEVETESWSHFLMVSPTDSARRKDSVTQFSAEPTQLRVIMATREHCGNCQRKETVYTSIAKRFGGAEVWFGIVNCSNPSSVKLCTRLRVSEDHGFPAVFAWRALHTSREADSLCESMPSADSGPEHDWLRINYHHALSEESIGAWIEELLEPSVRMRSSGDEVAALQEWPSTDGPTAHLHATFEVMPHSKTRSYFSWHCFQLVCRHLFSVAKCSATLNIPTTQPGKLVEHMDNLHYYLSKLTFQRADNEGTTLFKHGHPVMGTMSAESSQNLHDGDSLSHRAHRYGFLPTSHCEDDAHVCSRYIARFVQDHARLPVMPLSYTNFHMAKSLDSLLHADSSGADDSLLPYLIFIHGSDQEDFSDHLTQRGSGQSQLDTWMPVLDATARASYSTAKTVTLDADELSSWAEQFVPAGYFSRFSENPVPRLCWVDRSSSHSQAAFYPPPSAAGQLRSMEWIVGQQDNLIQSMVKFMTTASKQIIPSENF
eukprot:scpid28222/ scgid5009/ 